MKNKTRIETALLFVYLTTILWYTVFGRAIAIESVKIELFWSIKDLSKGNYGIGRQIVGNICLFIPVGFLLYSINKRRKIHVTLFWGFLLSITVENLQYSLMRGLFEVDDLIYNTLGTLIGAKAFEFLEKKIDYETLKSISIGFGIISVGVGILVCSFSNNIRVDSSTNKYCFQLEKVNYNSNDIELYGFCFQYNRVCDSPRISLKSTNSEKIIPLSVTYNIEREDVNQYFLCDNEYRDVGFYAVGKAIGQEEYEVMLSLGWPMLIPTGVYIREGQIYYAKSGTYYSPRGGEDLEKITTNGILRVYRPKEHCWIYQYHEHLYWIVDDQFRFENDGETVIQYQLETTQKNRLPQHRLENGWMWDNLSESFEDNEIYGDFGSYRVMKRRLPTEYSITSIETGYYQNGKWIWRCFFRPIYEFPEP